MAQLDGGEEEEDDQCRCLVPMSGEEQGQLGEAAEERPDRQMAATLEPWWEPCSWLESAGWPVAAAIEGGGNGDDANSLAMRSGKKDVGIQKRHWMGSAI